MPTTVAAALNVKSGGSRVAHAVTRKGRAYTLGMTPESATIDGLAYTVQQIQRPGLTPLVRLSAPQLRTLTFSHQVIRNTLTTLSSLQALARSGLEVRFLSVSSLEGSVWWRVQAFSVDITERLPDQSPKTATVNWGLIESIDIKPKIGKTPPPSGLFAGDLHTLPSVAVPPDIANPSDDDRRKAAGFQYTVKGQHTLYGVANEVWGVGGWWTYIANANPGKIKFDTRYVKNPPVYGQPDPTSRFQRSFLKPGLVLTIPPEPTGAYIPGQPAPTVPSHPDDPSRHPA